MTNYFFQVTDILFFERFPGFIGTTGNLFLEFRYVFVIIIYSSLIPWLRIQVLDLIKPLSWSFCAKAVSCSKNAG